MFSSLWIKATITLLLVALIVMGSCKMMKMAGCGGRKPRPPRPPRIVTVGPFDVIAVGSGASLTVKSGRRGERQVTLQGISAPATGQWVEVSRKHLEEMAGATVTVQYEKHGFRSESDESKDETVESRGPLTGTIIGASGINCNESQVAGGYADCDDAAPKSLQKAKAEAVKAKRGIWSAK